VSYALRARLFVGAVLVIAGTTLLAMTLGVIAVPADSWEAPLWIAALCGSAFVLGGGAIATASEAGEPVRPFLVRLAHHVSALAFIAVIGVVMAWVAFGPGPRDFEGQTSFFGVWRSDNDSEAGGRFGFGAIALLSAVIFVGAGVRAWRDLSTD